MYIILLVDTAVIIWKFLEIMTFNGFGWSWATWVTGDYEWLRVVLSGHKWLRVVMGYNGWLWVVKIGYLEPAKTGL